MKGRFCHDVVSSHRSADLQISRWQLMQHEEC